MVKKRTNKTVFGNKTTTKTAIAAPTIGSKTVAINKPKMVAGKKAIAPVATTTPIKKTAPVVTKPAVKTNSKTTTKTAPKIAAPAAPKMMSAKTTTKKTVKK